jgi:hypothetical protein
VRYWYFLIPVGCIFALVGYLTLISYLTVLSFGDPVRDQHQPPPGTFCSKLNILEYDHWTHNQIPPGYGGGIHEIRCGGKLWAMY